MSVSLTTVSKSFRKSVIILGIVAVAYYICILFVIPRTKALYAKLFPPGDPATNLYGTLPPLEFAEKKINNTEPPTFTIDTTDGNLPKDLPWKITVYKMNKPTPSFEKGKDATSTAATLGYFEADFVSTFKDKVFEWKKLESGGVLKIDTDSKEIELKTPMSGKSAYYPKGAINKELALNAASTLLNRIGRFDDELYREGRQDVILGRFESNHLEKTDVASDAQIARVDFFRSVNNYPILGADPKKGLVNITLKDPEKEEGIYYSYPELETHIWQIQTQSNATYEISPISEVWKLITNNKGVIANITAENSSNFEAYEPVTVESIFINNIYIAYYDNANYQEFLQPIYVFEGKYTTSGTAGGTITIYYPAIKPEWINKP